MSEPIKVTIVYNSKSKSKECGAYCGVDWALPEAATVASQRVKERFGDRIQMEYLDVSEPSQCTIKLKQAIEKENQLLPSLVIGGRIRISGQFDIRHLLDAIEAEIETKAREG
jgi:hypothetical protein